MIALEARPRLAAKARLRFDRHTGGHVLLYPERGLILNATAAAIVGLCDGSSTIAAIAERVAAQFGRPQSPHALAEVREFVTALAERGLVIEGS